MSRRFDRSQLVEAVIFDGVTEHLRFLDTALELPPWEGLTNYLESVRTATGRQEYLSFLTLALPTSPKVARIREATQKDQLKLVRRAQRSGELRKDIVPEDLVLIFKKQSVA